MSLRAARWLALCLLAGTFGAVAVPQASGVTAETRYVVSTGDNTENDCTDSANPCASLQYAIDQANAGDTIDVAGTLDSHVTIRTSLTITQWPDQASAVLDGTNSGRVVTVGDGSNTPRSVTLSDLTIENGNSDSAGGGVLNLYAELTVDDATFSDNSASGGGEGGAIASDDNSTLTVEHSTFTNNSASFGGGAIVDTGTMTVEDSTFSDNSSTQYIGGGAILEAGAGTVLRSTFVGNSAGPDEGGGIFVFVPGGSFPGPPASLLVADSTFVGNSAQDGGAIVSNGSITVESSTLTGNSATIGGAAIASANFNVHFAADIFAKQASGTNCLWTDTPIGSVDAGHNVDDDGTCGLSSANHSISDSSAIDDYLGSLADNGGPTQTVALLNIPSPTTSAADPALAVVPASFDLPEAVDSQSAACSVPDQRGVTPAAGIDCDAGAYLLQQTTTGLVSGGPVAPGQPVTYTATVSPAPDGGTVAFSDGAGNPATLNCAARSLTAGHATCTVSYAQAGVRSVTAAYSGDGASNNDAASTSSPVVETVRDTEPPTAPRALTGRFARNALHLSWKASHDNVGVNHYVIYLGTTRIGTVGGTETHATVHWFRRHGASVFTVRAFDAAGNRSKASNAVTIRSSP